MRVGVQDVILGVIPGRVLSGPKIVGGGDERGEVKLEYMGHLSLGWMCSFLQKALGAKA